MSENLISKKMMSVALLSAVALMSGAATFAAQSAPAASTVKKPLTVEALYTPGGVIPRLPSGLRWSPDSKHLTYHKGADLVEINLETGKSEILIDNEKLEKLNKTAINEKDKDHRARYGMADYIWSPDATKILFDQNGQLVLFDLKTQTGYFVAEAADSGDDPQFAPNGKRVAFVREHGLHLAELGEGTITPKALAPAPNAYTLNGEVDWVYEEELNVRSNYSWSPDSEHIAYLEMNEQKVPTYPITDWIPKHPETDNQRYPQAGDPNPAVRVGVVGLDGKTVWVELPIRANEDYIPRFGWLNAKTLFLETLTRDHKHKAIYFADAETGKAHLALELADDKFFNDTYDIYAAKGSLILEGWPDGHEHLYRYSYDDAKPATLTLATQLTKGDFEVLSVEHVDFDKSVVFYSSSEGDAIGSELWQVDFKGNRHAVTATAGVHHTVVSPDGAHFSDSLTTLTTTGAISLCANDGKTAAKCQQLWTRPTVAELGLVAPKIVQTTAHDGKTVLYSALLLPEGAKDAASVPVILNPYGGPGPMTVMDGWSDSYLFDQILLAHGFAVLHTDNRGSGHRGRDFHQAAYHNTGPVQFEDQLTALDHVLAQYPQLDKNRLAWWGWSWGGSFTLYALSHSDRFRAGVSVAPVTDWNNYDSIYTERYMSEPKDNPEGYKELSLLNSAKDLKGHLLIAHGTGDDNVHILNTVQYVQKLIEARKQYSLMIYPRLTHSIAGPDARVQLYNRIVDQFDTYLKPAVDPEPGTSNRAQ